MRKAGDDLRRQISRDGSALKNPAPSRFYNGVEDLDLRFFDSLFARHRESGFMTRTGILPDGRYYRIVDMGSVQRLEILESSNPQAPVVGTVVFGPDDYVCGVVTGFEVIAGSPNVIGGATLTTEGANRIDQERSEAKLAVPLDPLFATTGDALFQQTTGTLSQYKRMKPGNYTGTMRQLMQLLLGVGVTQSQTFEDRLIQDGKIDRTAFTPAERSVDPPIVPLVPGAVNNKPLYDYRVYKTEGLSWGSDGQCYIIQIGLSGLLAMRLPVTSFSRTEKGRKKIELLYPELFVPDGTGEGLFDRWGGFPTGETLGPTIELQARINSGEVVQILSAAEMGPFYSKQMYSAALGWAFAPVEPTAVNTCYGISSTGIKKGYLYFTRWNIGEWIEPDWTPEARALRDQFPLREQFRLNKLRRMTPTTQYCQRRTSSA